MPRASDYLLPGYTYHLTQRCHDRRFLLRFARDKDVYREWLREGIRRHKVPVYGFCVTGNHVHILAHADSKEAISDLMHLASGSTAKQYNLRKGRSGAMWQQPFHCTIVQDGRHLLNCLTYINLNMVRAGVVAHPREWRWCGHDELLGVRKRYCILDIDRLLESLGAGNQKLLREWYTGEIEQRISAREFQRESCWTESLAVGSRDFVEKTTREYSNRRTFSVEPTRLAWAVKESPFPYTAVSLPKPAAKP